MATLTYHPQWDLFPLNSLIKGTGLKLGRAEGKKMTDWLWFWYERMRTMKIQQSSYINAEHLQPARKT